MIMMTLRIILSDTYEKITLTIFQISSEYLCDTVSKLINIFSFSCMKTYTLPIQFQFQWTIEVQANSLDEANAIIEKNIRATSITIENNQTNEPFDHRSITNIDISSYWDIVFLPITMDSLNLPS